MTGKEVVLVSGCRTAIAKFQGALKDVSARDLAITAGKEAVKRANIALELIDEIVMGQCLPGLQGSLPARQVSARIGLADISSAVLINQNCASGMRALDIAANNIMLGKTNVALVVGVESMTNAPYMLAKARSGYKMEPGTLEDSMLYDALIDELAGDHMAITAERVAEKYHITREECDTLAAISHNRATAAVETGLFTEEIVPVEIETSQGRLIFEQDERPMANCSPRLLARFRPAFKAGGVVTAANASGINDGAAAVILMSLDKAKEQGIIPLMKLINVSCAGVAPEMMGLGPAVAIPKCLKEAGMKFEDIDYWEINEAFAAQFIGVKRMLEEEYGIHLHQDKVNHNGSAISLGHPVGCTALRIIVSLYYEMARNNYSTGGASLCAGTGPAIASLWTRDI